MKIALSGSTGFIGAALRQYLQNIGHSVFPLVREQNPGELVIGWIPTTGEVDSHKLEGVDAIVHLAGENIFGRWAPSKKKKIMDSRSLGTRLLAEGIARLRRPPPTFLCACAIGIYGDRGDEVLSEKSAPGSGFLAEVCEAWEKATSPASNAGVRVVNMRFGVVLDPSGGALKQMLPVFRLGLGGPLGDGRQYFSWVTRSDVFRIIEFILGATALSGPINVVAPNSVTNESFTKSIAGVLRRPAKCRVPAALLRMVLGEMAEALLLASTRVSPEKLVNAGFQFAHPTMESALEAMLVKAPRGSSLS